MMMGKVWSFEWMWCTVSTSPGTVWVQKTFELPAFKRYNLLNHQFRFAHWMLFSSRCRFFWSYFYFHSVCYSLVCGQFRRLRYTLENIVEWVFRNLNGCFRWSEVVSNEKLVKLLVSLRTSERDITLTALLSVGAVISLLNTYIKQFQKWANSGLALLTYLVWFLTNIFSSEQLCFV